MDYDDYVKIVRFCNSKHKVEVNDLATYLDLSRNTLVKKIQHLVDCNDDFDAITNECVFRVEGTNLYNINILLAYLQLPKSLKIFIFTKLDSTNTFLKSASLKKFKRSLCIAEMQTEGRGRRGKTWQSPFGENIYFSLRRKLYISPQNSGCLSLIAGISLVTALNRLGCSGLKIKWPNDILFGSRKLAGILIEIISTKENSIELIIGIGINLNMTQSSSMNINQPWVNLSEINSRLTDRNKIIATIVNQLEENLTEFETSGMQKFNTQWLKYDSLIGKEIIIRQDKSEIIGTANGINTIGELLVESKGQTLNINAGEVSVRLNSK